MARKSCLLLILIVSLITLGVFAIKGFGKDEKSDKKEDLSIVSEKIEEVLKNQQDIITRLNDIREQQDIIRVRASRK